MYITPATDTPLGFLNKYVVSAIFANADEHL